VFDDLLASIAHMNETANQLGRVEDRALAHHDRIGLRRPRCELLQKRAHAGDDDARRSVGVAEPPDHFEASSHGLDARAHALERQRLPCREQRHVVGGNERHEIIEHLAGHGSGGTGHDEWTSSREFGQRRDGDDSGRIGNGEDSVGGSEERYERAIVTQARRQRRENAGNRTIAGHSGGRLSGGVHRPDLTGR
jgi:hypothetical protein